MAVIPKVGDTLHYVKNTGLHCPAFVMVEAETPKGTVGLFVFDADANHFEHTVGLDAFQCSLLKRERVPWAKAAEDVIGTWHWPEGRERPSAPSPGEEDL